jgi:DNA modification methylase
MSLPEPFYQEDGITLYCGDNREILPELGQFDLGVISPPYNLYKQGWDSGISGIPGHKDLMRKFTIDWYEDEMPEGEYQQTQVELLDIARAKCAGSICYNHKVRYAFKRAGSSFHPMQWLLKYPLWVEIIWDKGGGIAFNTRRPVPSDERIFVLGRPKAWHDLKLTTVWRMPADSEAPKHPCAFPVELPSRLIAMFTDPGDTVVDWFSGAGTTLVAAKRLGRKAVGIEISEEYCALAVKRLAQSVMQFHTPSDLEKESKVG